MSSTAYIERLLEESAAGINEMVQKEYITKNEATSIFKKRKIFESKVMSLTVEKEHFLNYLNYEINFLLLMKTRKNLKNLPVLTKWREICRHTSIIFERALKKYRTDELLWKSYLDWSIEYSFRVDHHFESALQTNPDNENIWVLATKWQVEVNQSPESARNIFQRGVKLLPFSEKLWVAFFKFEVQNSIEIIEEEDDEEEEKEIQLKKVDDPNETYKVPILIFDQIDKIPAFDSNFKLRFEMLEILNFVPNTETIQNFILEKILKKFASDVECLTKCLTFKFNRELAFNSPDLFNVEKETIESFNQVSKLIPSPKLFESYSRFCLESLNRNKNEKKNVEYLSNHMINELYFNVNTHDMFTESSYLDYCYLLILLGYHEIAKETLETSIIENPLSFKLIKLHIQFLVNKKTNSTQISKLMEQYLKKFDSHLNDQMMREYEVEENKHQLWMFYIDYLKNNCDTKAVEKHWKDAMIGCNTFEMKRKCFDWYCDHFGVEGGRKASSLILNILPNTVEIYRMMIQFETELKDKNIENLTVFYESVIQQCGEENEDIWIEYIQLMNKVGNLRKAHTLYYLATKTLKNVQMFLQKYEKIK